MSRCAAVAEDHGRRQLKPSQTGLLDSELTDLRRHQISVNQGTFGMWWNRKSTSWMCRKLSLRNISSTLLRNSEGKTGLNPVDGELKSPYGGMKPKQLQTNMGPMPPHFEDECFCFLI